MSHVTANPTAGDSASSIAFFRPMPSRDDSPASPGEPVPPEPVPGAVPEGMQWWGRVFPDEDSSTAQARGLRLGHFRIEERIGRGGMGAVFRAVDTRLDRVVALKVLAPYQATDQACVDRFHNEARAAARLDHDNIARVYYVGEDQGVHFIAFEFVHGATIRDLILRDGPLSAADVVNFSLQIAHALRHTDAAGVVHRDIKPSNIIVTPSGRAKLVDLGLARKHDPEASKDLTVDGTTLGTFDYISPEQAKDPRAVDVRSDIYSLGCTMFHMLTGEPPYPSGTMLQKLLDHQGKQIPDPAMKNPSVPPELSAVVRQMMASEPSDRYASADELVYDLSLIAHALGLRGSPPEGLIWTKPPSQPLAEVWARYRGWILTLGLLLVVVFAIDRAQSYRSERGLTPPVATRGGPAPTASRALPTNEQPALPSDASPAVPSAAAAELADVDYPDAESSSAPHEELPRETIAASGVSTAESSEQPLEPRSDLPAPFGPPERTPLADPSAHAASADGEEAIVQETTGVRSVNGAQATPRAVSPNGEATTRPAGPDDATPAGAGQRAVDPSAVRPRSNPFGVVLAREEPPEFFPTLEAACRAAPDNGVVEIHFDGRFPEPQPPLRITNKHLTVRAAAGLRPTIRFAPREAQDRPSTARMISVQRGSLEVYNVDLEVVVEPDAVIEQWILVSLSRADQLVLRGVSLTINNTAAQPAALVEFAAPGVQELPELMSDAMKRPPVRVDFANSLLRGEADLFLGENCDPARIRLDNVAIGLEGALLRLHGVDSLLFEYVPDELIELMMQHVTAVLTKPLLNVQVRPDYTVPEVAVDSRDCVVVIPDAPLIEMAGDKEVFDFQNLVSWSGNTNFLQIVDPVWRIASEFSLSGPKEFRFEEWQDVWYRTSRSERRVSDDLLGIIPTPNSPFSELTADDFRLQTGGLTENPAVDNASDGHDAGVQLSLERIPMGPSDSEVNDAEGPTNGE